MPEPSSIILISSGLGGILIRYARVQFANVKRAVDIAVVVLTLPLTVPMTFLLAFIVRKTSPGAAFYSQERVGLDGEIFHIYKLRSMRLDAEEKTGPVWASVGEDPRITKFGQFLRKSHLDELPQLYNVLIGDMSIIGPRPERPFFVNKLTRDLPDYQKRMQIKPGITGLAQVLQKADETLDDARNKLTYDLAYIKRAGWFTDFLIAIRTCLKMILGDRLFSKNKKMRKLKVFSRKNNKIASQRV